MERSQPRSIAHGGAGDREQARLESRLFVATERWGWEYLDVAPAAFDAGPDPEWFEPPPERPPGPVSRSTTPSVSRWIAAPARRTPGPTAGCPPY